MQVAKFSRPQGTFSQVLKERVNEYFKSANIRPTGDARLFTKSIILLLTGVITYVGWLFMDLPLWASISCAIVMGINHALIGFNMMHDGAHGSYSSNRKLNALMAYTLNLVGGNAFYWNLKHNVAHHTFPNVEGHDEDIDIWPFIRSNEHQKKLWFHRYQHLYGMVLYCVTYLQWIFMADMRKYMSGSIANSQIKGFTVRQHVIFWVTKLVYAGIFIALPVYMLGWTVGILSYLASAAATGIVIAVTFQLAHVNEMTHFVVPDPETNTLADEFSVHQFATTANFATRSKVAAWVFGGLNFQVEHHVFPKISHVHYPAIKPIVERTCREFNVPYLEYPTILQAIASHLRYLKLVGTATN
jgi:linoleoyl-CoA desaturase